MLKCETNTPEMRKDIEQLIEDHETVHGSLFFEHGQWFVINSDTYPYTIWSVIDVEDNEDDDNIISGFDFELIQEGEDDWYEDDWENEIDYDEE